MAKVIDERCPNCGAPILEDVSELKDNDGSLIREDVVYRCSRGGVDHLGWGWEPGQP